MNETISVIIPVYNIAEYIANCLKSVLSQSYQHLEVIVVDDGSSDGSGDVAEKIAENDRRVRVIRQANGGVTSARLRGIREATGEWIGFVDGDDFIEPQMYELLLKNAHLYEADISHCGYQKIYAKRVGYFYNTGKITEYSKGDALKGILSGSIEPGLCNKLYRKTLFRQILQENGIDTSIRNNEDRLMNYYLFRAAENSVFEDVCPYHYVVRRGSATHPENKDAKFRDPIRVWEILLAETRDEPDLNGLCLERLAVHLARYAKMKTTQDRAEQFSIPVEAREMLNKRLPEILRHPYCSLKVKARAWFAALWPASYRGIHTAYKRLKKRIKH